ncbi:MAG TPA: zinc dependent phospholipase C family protein, partial [Armatimonadota bacterium]
MMRMAAVWCVVMLLGVAMCSAQAGQMAGHEYTALAAESWLTGNARAMVAANQDAYLSGAQGPDTTGIVMYNLNLAFNAVGEESHYSDRKAALALAILDAAKNDREKAYALGWITHYINDYFVHPVVNEYGGYYATDPKHHKELEQLETKYVFSAHGDIVTQEMSNNIPMNLGPTFANFIFDGYHATFPEEKRYQTGKEWVGSNNGYFCKRYNEASDWSLAASRDFYLAHSNGSGKHGSLASWTESLAVWKLFPPMPSTKEYDALAHPLELTKI